ncbi:protein CYPRO4-like [Carex rostrata]
MGGSHSREGLELSDSETDSEEEEELSEEEELLEGEKPVNTPINRSQTQTGTPTSISDIDTKLQSLKLKYSPSTSSPSPNSSNQVKLYLHTGGTSPSARWIVSEKSTHYSFIQSTNGEDNDDSSYWFLIVGFKVRALVSRDLQLKAFPDQRRVDFVSNGVWALKFGSAACYHEFYTQYDRGLFENTFGVEATDENRIKIFGKDFMAWAHPSEADDDIWEDAEEDLERSSRILKPIKRSADLLEEYEEEVANSSGVQSLALGALDNSFLVGNSGIQVVKNLRHGIQGRGVSVKIENQRGGFSTPSKALLMKAETNMLLMSPEITGRPQSTGLHQVDIETGKIVTDWKFEKDGTDITMRDITNDSKGSQLDPSQSTFLGLDDNRLCRWDMRDKRGMVQDISSSAVSPVLEWAQGHNFSRGTNFQCFASTGDGSIVVGSLDGKIRLYSNSSMRMAKTAFPGLGSPITHVDVTYDGKWILGTTDTYLVLICTLFKDKDGKEKTGFSGRMGNRISAPRLLKLTPLDSHLAGADNKFHGGQFSWVTENGKQERHLVATVGKFSVIWDFQQVKNNKHECYANQEGLKTCYCYKILLKDDSIVDSRFMHEKFASGGSPGAPLVVATPKKVSSFSISTPSRRI